MVEVIMASVIFTITVVGVFATYTSIRQPSSSTDEKIKAAYIGKKLLDELRANVSADTWELGNSALALGAYRKSEVVDGITYWVDYIIEPDPGGTAARKVTVTVRWDEVPPPLPPPPSTAPPPTT